MMAGNLVNVSPSKLRAARKFLQHCIQEMPKCSNSYLDFVLGCIWFILALDVMLEPEWELRQLGLLAALGVVYKLMHERHGKHNGEEEEVNQHSQTVIIPCHTDKPNKDIVPSGHVPSRVSHSAPKVKAKNSRPTPLAEICVPKVLIKSGIVIDIQDQIITIHPFPATGLNTAVQYSSTLESVADFALGDKVEFRCHEPDSAYSAAAAAAAPLEALAARRIQPLKLNKRKLETQKHEREESFSRAMLEITTLSPRQKPVAHFDLIKYAEQLDSE